jgi:hypothetical protein
MLMDGETISTRWQSTAPTDGASLSLTFVSRRRSFVGRPLLERQCAFVVAWPAVAVRNLVPPDQVVWQADRLKLLLGEKDDRARPQRVTLVWCYMV